ncbi:unnamed protein product [Amoebophrya sp. A120]|nr:unnamed protein product [Amoebophrya sp. A120]|eukprot:GSA120T00022958001.1
MWEAFPLTLRSARVILFFNSATVVVLVASRLCGLLLLKVKKTLAN